MPQDITQLLLSWKDGDKDALNQLMPIVYAELYKLANKYITNERSNHTLQPTALVNEAYLKFVQFGTFNWQNRAHFLAVAAQVMRNILVDHARKQMASKRADPKNKVSLEDLSDQTQTKDFNLVVLNDVLEKFTLINKEQSQIVELRFFGGLTIEEIAEVMKLSPQAVWRKWEIAKLWLLRELNTKD